MLHDKTKKNLIAITTDDLCPSNIKMWDIFDQLKEKFPHLKVTAFTIPRFKNLDSEDISLQGFYQLFKNWFYKRKDWVEIGLHGLTHGHPPEFLRHEEYQKNHIKQSLNKLESFLPHHIGLRPPGFKYNEFTIRACAHLNISYIATQTELITLKPVKDINCTLYNSHLSKNQPDSLNLIKNNLEKLLDSSNCVTLSELFL